MTPQEIKLIREERDRLRDLIKSVVESARLVMSSDDFEATFSEHGDEWNHALHALLAEVQAVQAGEENQ